LSEEEVVKKLAEMKAYLEKRIAELEGEISRLKSFLEVIDVTLTEKSFRRVELPKPTLPSAAPPAAAPATPPTYKQIVPLRTAEGVQLADLYVGDVELKVVPAADMKFNVNSPPLKAFLIGRVLDPMQAKDREAARTGEITPEKILSYRIEQEGDLVREIIIRNYGDERRLLELKNAIRWTLRRMYERSVGLG
jgi:hypothetical protein